MSSVTLDRETLASLSERLDRVAAEFTEAERSQLTVLLAVGSSEVARLADLEPAAGDGVDILGGGFGAALHPLTGAGAPREVMPFGAGATTTTSSQWSASGSVTMQPGSVCLTWGGWTASGQAQGSHSGSTTPSGSGGKK